MTESTFIELYQRQKESGLTVREFCTNEIIAPSTFFNWQKKLRKKNRLPGFIPVTITSTPERPANIPNIGCVPHQTYTASPQSQIEIEFSNKTIVRINGGVDIATLQALIQLNG